MANQECLANDFARIMRALKKYWSCYIGFSECCSALEREMTAKYRAGVGRAGFVVQEGAWAAVPVAHVMAQCEIRRNLVLDAVEIVHLSGQEEQVESRGAPSVLEL